MLSSKQSEEETLEQLSTCNMEKKNSALNIYKGRRSHMKFIIQSHEDIF